MPIPPLKTGKIAGIFLLSRNFSKQFWKTIFVEWYRRTFLQRIHFSEAKGNIDCVD